MAKRPLTAAKVLAEAKDPLAVARSREKVGSASGSSRRSSSHCSQHVHVFLFRFVFRYSKDLSIGLMRIL